jgi:hypothetical protein
MRDGGRLVLALLLCLVFALTAVIALGFTAWVSGEARSTITGLLPVLLPAELTLVTGATAFYFAGERALPGRSPSGWVDPHPGSIWVLPATFRDRPHNAARASAAAWSRLGAFRKARVNTVPLAGPGAPGYGGVTVVHRASARILLTLLHRG